VRSDTTPVAALDGSVLGERRRRRGREPAEGEPAGRAHGRRRDHLSDDDRGDRLREAPPGGDCDRREPERHRERKEERANVVAATQDERRAGERLGRLSQRQQRGDQERHDEPVRAEERFGSRG
jgi:hypothetical protein